MAHKSTFQIVFIPVIAISVLLIMVAWLAGYFNNKVSPAIIAEQSISSNTWVTNKDDVYTVISSTEQTFEPIAASIEAKQATKISSRILARIKEINVRSGDKVKKGDVLIQLEQSDLQSHVLQAKQSIIAMQARFDEAKQNFERSKAIFAKQLISTFDLDKSRADYQNLLADLTAAQQQLIQAETTLSYATLTAPIDGLIVDRFAEPGDTAQAGAKLLTLYNPLSLRVEAHVREQLAMTLKLGQPMTIELPSINKTVTGEIEEIVPAANSGSRSFLVKARITNNESLLPGMYARLLVPSGEQIKLNIPTNKVAHIGQLDFVWVNVDNKAQRRLVRLGKAMSDQMVSVISGLTVGDELMTPAHP